MPTRRKIEIFSAGCPACADVVARIRDLACLSCEIVVLDMSDGQVARRARALGVRSVPAVAVDGTLADCCSGRGPDISTLQAAGLGKPIAGAP